MAELRRCVASYFAAQGEIMSTRVTMAVALAALAISAAGCHLTPHPPRLGFNAPPAQQILEPGPGVGGPGPGVIPPMMPGPGPAMPSPEVQVLFDRLEGVQVRWDVSGAGMFDSEPLIVPGRNNFAAGGIYRLKITSIDGHPGVELYPTLEIGPISPRTAAYLSHNAIPVQFTIEDVKQVRSGNYVTKVIYLPNPEFQKLAVAGPNVLVSTRLDAGRDPIVEADRRGSILAIIRMGNIDKETPGGFGQAGVAPISYNAPGGPAAQVAGLHGAACGPGCYDNGYGGGYGAYGGGAGYPPAASGPMPPAHLIAGAGLPQYGMPITGTPIGLPGPPHIPHGSPAGLQRHTMFNHTRFHLPGPSARQNIHVQQTPGISYPAPADTMHVRERVVGPIHQYGQPTQDLNHVRGSANPFNYCPPGTEGGQYCPPGAGQ